MIQRILNFCFPKNCCLCQAPGTHLCLNCCDTLPLSSTKIDRTSTMPDLTTRYLTGVLAATDYRHPGVKKAIHNFKYQSIKEIGWPLGRVMRRRVQPFLENNPHPWLVIPIPLHRRRRLERGFNQNEILARACFTDTPLATVLVGRANPLRRPRYTKSQTTLNGVGRARNMSNAFYLTTPAAVRDQSVILVDDLITTGATLYEAARVLSASGARVVWGLTLAQD